MSGEKHVCSLRLGINENNYLILWKRGYFELVWINFYSSIVQSSACGLVKSFTFYYFIKIYEICEEYQNGKIDVFFKGWLLIMSFLCNQGFYNSMVILKL